MKTVAFFDSKSYDKESFKKIVGEDINIRFFENKFLILSLLAGIALQLCVVNIPPLADVFKTTPLSVKEWSVVIGLSIMPLAIVEIQKLFSLIQSKRK